MAEDSGHQRLHSRRCLNHPNREAVARCPGCGRFYCRECVTEHEGKVLCSSCLKKARHKPLARRLRLATLGRLLQGLLSFLLLWSMFYYIGQGLLSIPDPFHEGTIWDEGID